MNSPGLVRVARSDGPLTWYVRAFVGYGALAALGVLLRDPSLQPGTFWPATGLAAALALLGWRRSHRHLVAVLAGVAAAEVLTSFAAGGDPRLLPGVLAADVATPAVFTASFTWRHGQARSGRIQWQHLFRLVCATAAAALIGGLIGGTALAMASDTAWCHQVTLWAAGNGCGILLVVPLILGAPGATGMTRPLETVANGAFTAASVVVAFGRSEPAPTAYLVVPGIVWSAVRLGPKWTWGTVTATSAAVTYLGEIHRGPFGAHGTTHLDAVLLQQVFLCVVAVMTSLLAAALAEAERHRRDLQRSIDDALPGMMLISLEGEAPGRVRSANPAMAQLLDLEPHDLVGAQWISLIAPADRPVVRLIMSRLTQAAPQRWRGELVHQRADGSRVHTLVAAAAVNGEDDRAATVQVLDISEQKAAEAELRRAAQHDELTGLANRALMSERVERALRARTRDRTGVALLFIDVDGFKGVNDSRGHACGDALLVAIAGRLRAAIRPGDVASRIGGDEFAVVCTELEDVADAERVAARIVQVMAKPFTIDGHLIQLGVSVGVTYTREASTADALLRQADSAMYVAKRKGRSRWETYGKIPRSRTSTRLEMDPPARALPSTGSRCASPLTR